MYYYTIKKIIRMLTAAILALVLSACSFQGKVNLQPTDTTSPVISFENSESSKDSSVPSDVVEPQISTPGDESKSEAVPPTEFEAAPIIDDENINSSSSGAVNDAPEYTTDSAKNTAHSVDLTGPWHLDEKEYDPDYLAETFPGYGEWGSSMEIRSNGQISWYIGAEGWNGTYELDSNGLRANMIADLDRTEKTWFFKLVEGSGNASLKMDYNGTALVWKYGDQPDSPAGEGAVG